MIDKNLSSSSMTNINNNSIQFESCNKMNKSNLDQFGKNFYQLKCLECGSLILSKGVATFIQNLSFNVPLMFQKNQDEKIINNLESEQVSFWWSVDDMFAFENIGFTHSHNGQKYLACADCEIGPVGLVDKKKYLVAINRVSQK